MEIPLAAFTHFVFKYTTQKNLYFDFRPFNNPGSWIRPWINIVVREIYFNVGEHVERGNMQRSESSELANNIPPPSH